MNASTATAARLAPLMERTAARLATLRDELEAVGVNASHLDDRCDTVNTLADLLARDVAHEARLDIEDSYDSYGKPRR